MKVILTVQLNKCVRKIWYTKNDECAKDTVTKVTVDRVSDCFVFLFCPFEFI